MTGTGGSSRSWRRLAAELLALEREDRPVLPDLDEQLVARFVADECTDSEVRRVEAALGAEPLLRELVEVARRALAETEFVRESELRREAGTSVWNSLGAIRELGGQLCAWIDEVGQTAADGLQQWLVGPQLALGNLLAGPESLRNEPVSWELPLGRGATTLTVTCWPGEGQDSWRVGGRLQAGEEASAGRARIEFRRAGGELEMAVPLAEWVVEPAELAAGHWQLCLLLGEETWRIPLVLGRAGGRQQ